VCFLVVSELRYPCNGVKSHRSLLGAFGVAVAGKNSDTTCFLAELARQGKTVLLLLFYAVIAASLYGLARLEKREPGVDGSLIYEDEPDPIVRSLELG
jgi:hypothetical protein